MTTSAVHSMLLIIYFKPTFCLKFRWLIWCIVSQIYYFYHTTKLISVLSFFWRYIYIYISFFRYFLIILIFNCLWIILLRSFQGLRDSVSNFITNQIISCFSWVFFLNFEAVLSALVACCLAWSSCLWLYLPLEFLLKFLPTFFLYS